jgi:hypothetical protein
MRDTIKVRSICISIDLPKATGELSCSGVATPRVRPSCAWRSGRRAARRNRSNATVLPPRRVVCRRIRNANCTLARLCKSLACRPHACGDPRGALLWKSRYPVIQHQRESRVRAHATRAQNRSASIASTSQQSAAVEASAWRTKTELTAESRRSEWEYADDQCGYLQSAESRLYLSVWRQFRQA